MEILGLHQSLLTSFTVEGSVRTHIRTVRSFPNKDLVGALRMPLAHVETKRIRRGFLDLQIVSGYPLIFGNEGIQVFEGFKGFVTSLSQQVL